MHLGQTINDLLDRRNLSIDYIVSQLKERGISSNEDMILNILNDDYPIKSLGKEFYNNLAEILLGKGASAEVLIFKALEADDIPEEKRDIYEKIGGMLHSMIDQLFLENAKEEG